MIMLIIHAKISPYQDELQHQKLHFGIEFPRTTICLSNFEFNQKNENPSLFTLNVAMPHSVYIIPFLSIILCFLIDEIDLLAQRSLTLDDFKKGGFFLPTNPSLKIEII